MRGVMVLLLLVTAACSPAPERPAVPPSIARYPVRLLAGAEFEGRLTLDGQCLFLVSPDGTIYGTAWPANGTIWDAAGYQLIVGDMAAPVGARIRLGAEIAELDDDHADGFVVGPRPECRGDAFLFVQSFVSVDADD